MSYQEEKEQQIIKIGTPQKQRRERYQIPSTPVKIQTEQYYPNIGNCIRKLNFNSWNMDQNDPYSSEEEKELSFQDLTDFPSTPVQCENYKNDLQTPSTIEPISAIRE